MTLAAAPCGKLVLMITGAHFLMYSKDAEADRAFLRDVIGFRSVDIGHGWLIFAMPPTEMAVHPGTGDFVESHGGQSLIGAVLYLMCSDLRAYLASLEKKNVKSSPLVEADWGISSTIPLPSGASIGVYQPAHPTAI
jgi:hypothetical protein